MSSKNALTIHHNRVPRVSWPNDCDFDGFADTLELSLLAERQQKVVVDWGHA